MLGAVAEVKLKVQRSPCQVPGRLQHGRPWMPAASWETIHSPTNGLLSTYYVPGSTLPPGDRAGTKADKEVVPMELTDGRWTGHR